MINMQEANSYKLVILILQNIQSMVLIIIPLFSQISRKVYTLHIFHTMLPGHSLKLPQNNINSDLFKIINFMLKMIPSFIKLELFPTKSSEPHFNLIFWSQLVMLLIMSLLLIQMYHNLPKPFQSLKTTQNYYKF